MHVANQNEGTTRDSFSHKVSHPKQCIIILVRTSPTKERGHKIPFCHNDLRTFCAATSRHISVGCPRVAESSAAGPVLGAGRRKQQRHVRTASEQKKHKTS